MRQIAIFVDAGYLLAEGGFLLAGFRPPRAAIRIDVDTMIESLRQIGAEIAGSDRLLRIYWYDGLARRSGMSLEQQRICLSADVKARFGRVNAHGQQKGVDTLLVTDLIGLARMQAISDALIISGDEDLRVGLELAQAHGVRIHLAGVPPVRDNQSFELQAEADGLIELSVEQISSWLAVSPAAEGSHRSDFSRAIPPPEAAELTTDFILQVVAEQVGKLDDEDLDWVQGHIVETRGALPREFDGPSLVVLSNRIGRELVEAERRSFRRALVEAVSQRTNHSSPARSAEQRDEES